MAFHKISAAKAAVCAAFAAAALVAEGMRTSSHEDSLKLELAVASGPCDDLCLPLAGVCQSFPPLGWQGNPAELTVFCEKKCTVQGARCAGAVEAPLVAVKDDEDTFEEVEPVSQKQPEEKPTGPCSELCLPLAGACQSFPPLGYKGPMSSAQLDDFCAKQCHPEGLGCAGAPAQLLPIQTVQEEVSAKTDEEQDAAAPKCPTSGNVVWNYKNLARCRDAATMKFVKTACCSQLIEAEAAKQAEEEAKAAAAKAEADRLAEEAAQGKVAEEQVAAAKAEADAAEQAAKDLKVAEAACGAVFDKVGKKACRFPMKPEDVAKHLKGSSIPAGYSCQKGYKCLKSGDFVRLVPGSVPSACGTDGGKGLTGVLTCVPLKLR